MSINSAADPTQLPSGTETCLKSQDAPTVFDQLGNGILSYSDSFAYDVATDDPTRSFKRPKLDPTQDFAPVELKGRLVTKELVDSFNSYFSAQTLAVLIAITEIPPSWNVIVSDQVIKTRNWAGVIHVAWFAYVPSVPPSKIGHWILFHINFVQKRATCYDSLHDPKQKMSQSSQEAIQTAVENVITYVGLEFAQVQWHYKSAVSASFKFQALDPSLIACLQRTIAQLDGTGCGALAWRELERLLGTVTGAEEPVHALRQRLVQTLLHQLSEAKELTLTTPHELEEVLNVDTPVDQDEIEGNPAIHDKLRPRGRGENWAKQDVELLLVAFGESARIADLAKFARLLFPKRTSNSLKLKRSRVIRSMPEELERAERIMKGPQKDWIDYIIARAPHVHRSELLKEILPKTLAESEVIRLTYRTLDHGSPNGRGVLVVVGRLSGDANNDKKKRLMCRIEQLSRTYIRDHSGFVPRVVKIYVASKTSSNAWLHPDHSAALVNIFNDRRPGEPLIICMAGVDSLTANLASLQQVFASSDITNATIQVLEEDKPWAVFSVPLLSSLYLSVKEARPTDLDDPEETVRYLHYLARLAHIAELKWRKTLLESSDPEEAQASLKRNVFSLEESKKKSKFMCTRCNKKSSRLAAHMRAHASHDDFKDFSAKITNGKNLIRLGLSKH